jgi:hypothetical protein
MDVPRFDGENPKLWQLQCEDYFEMYHTAPHLWVRLASLQFSGPAARWLSSVQNSIRKFTWQEFSQEVMLHFCRTQYQSLIRKLYKLVQTGSVEEYVHQFAELIDQLAAYEEKQDVLHYVTRFIDGLKPAVRVLVVVQLPHDLEIAYNIACVQEEVTESLLPNVSSSFVPRRVSATSSYNSRVQEIKQPPDNSKSSDSSRISDDKLAALKSYRRAKGLCFTCGERYSRDHKCQSTVQLHVVQEMVEFMNSSPESCYEFSDTTEDMELMQLAVGDNAPVAPERSIVLQCSVQGRAALFLLDSGSSNSFISGKLASHISGHIPLKQPRRVTVAGGGILQCTHYIPDCPWVCDNCEFSTSFKILPLQSYDGIVGMAWLSSHSPQVVDWNQKWLAFQHQGAWVCLQGQVPTEFACTIVELHLLNEQPTNDASLPAEIAVILEQFADVFSMPQGLPPKRAVSHSIPLVAGARPVQIRPYHFAPELKNEIETQIAEML